MNESSILPAHGIKEYYSLEPEGEVTCRSPISVFLFENRNLIQLFFLSINHAK